MTTNKTDEIRNADGFIVSPDGGGGGYGGSGYVSTTFGAVSGDRAEIDSLRAENKRLKRQKANIITSFRVSMMRGETYTTDEDFDAHIKKMEALNE